MEKRPAAVDEFADNITGVTGSTIVVSIEDARRILNYINLLEIDVEESKEVISSLESSIHTIQNWGDKNCPLCTKGEDGRVTEACAPHQYANAVRGQMENVKEWLSTVDSALSLSQSTVAKAMEAITA